MACPVGKWVKPVDNLWLDDLPEETMSRLEHETATKAEKDASDRKAVQVAQGRKIARLDARVGEVEDRVDRGFAEMHRGFAEMREGFSRAAVGHARIVALLATHLEECGSD
jgi:hypothetical protein